MRFKVTFDIENKLDSKPTADKVKVISNSLKTVIDCDIDRFVKGIESGYSFCPAVFNGKRNNENFKSQQIFALDIDSKTVSVEPIEVIELLESYGITSNIVYTTYSDTIELRRFRVIVVVDEEVTDKKLRDRIQQTLMNICKHSDKACSDSARLFYPSKSVIHIDYFINSLIDIVEIANKMTKTDENRVVRVQLNRRNDVVDRIYKIMQNKTVSFIEGERHNYTTIFAGLCNVFGLSSYDCYSLMVENGTYSNVTMSKVEDIYKRYYHKHNTYKV
jgi:hypothetical protein